MIMRLRLQQAVQENDYYFRGFVTMTDLAEIFRAYPFREETLEKAAIHRRNMEQGISPFSVTLRAVGKQMYHVKPEFFHFKQYISVS